VRGLPKSQTNLWAKAMGRSTAIFRTGTQRIEFFHGDKGYTQDIKTVKKGADPLRPWAKKGSSATQGS